MGALPGFDFAYQHKGLLEIFQTQAVADHAHHTVEKGKALGLDVELLNYEQLQKHGTANKDQWIGRYLF